MLATDLLYANIRANKGVRRRSTLMRAVNKVNFMTKMKKAVEQNKKSAYEIEMDKQKLRREMRERKALSAAMSGQAHTNRNGKMLDLGMLEDVLSTDPGAFALFLAPVHFISCLLTHIHTHTVLCPLIRS